MAERWIARRAKTAGSLAGSHFNCHQCAYQSSDFTDLWGDRFQSTRRDLVDAPDRYVLSLLKSFH
jgi:hypothetical protein